jgi:type III secretion translocon protein HrpF
MGEVRGAGNAGAQTEALRQKARSRGERTAAHTAFEQAKADAAARTIYEALKGGLTGAGTTRGKVWRTLEGKSTEELNLIRASYKKNFHQDMDAAIRGELSGYDLQRANALLKGKGNWAAVQSVRMQSELGSWFNTDEKKVLNILADASLERRHEIATAFAKKYGDAADQRNPEAFLFKRMKAANAFNDGELSRAQKLLAASAAKGAKTAAKFDAEAEVARLRSADGFFRADGDAIKHVLARKSADQIKAIDTAMRAMHGQSLDAFLCSATSGAERDILLHLAHPSTKGDEKSKSKSEAEVSAAQIKKAGSGWFYTDRATIDRALSGKKPEEVKKAFERQYHEKLEHFLGRLAKGKGERDVWMRMLNPPAVNDARTQMEARVERIKRALEREDANALRQEFANQSKAQNALTAKAFEQKYGEKLRSEMMSELSHRDRREIVKQLFDRGAVDLRTRAGVQEQIKRTWELMNKEGGIGLNLTGGIQSLSPFKDMTDRRRIKTFLGEAQAALNRGDTQEAVRLLKFAQGGLESMRGAKDSFADGAAEGAAIAAAVTVEIASGGTATPLVAGAWAMRASRIALTAATAEGLTYKVMAGDTADTSKVFKHTVAGATTGIPVWKFSKLPRLAQPTVRGSLAGGMSTSTITALEPETWKDGFLPGMKRVGVGAAEGIVAGALTGGLIHSTAGAVKVLKRAKTTSRDVPDFFDDLATRSSQRELDPIPGSKLTLKDDGFVTVGKHGDLNALPIGVHGDDSTKLLWTVDKEGAHFVPETKPWDSSRGIPSHTNISDDAYFAGEAWRTGTNEITINSGSRAFGYNWQTGNKLTGVKKSAYMAEMQNRYNRAVEYFESFGLKVKVVPLGER